MYKRNGITAGCTATSAPKSQTIWNGAVRSGVSIAFQKAVFIPGTRVVDIR